MPKKNKKRSKLIDRTMEIIAMCIILDSVILFIHLLWPKDFILPIALIIIAIVDILIILFGEKIFGFLIEIISPF
ncbi:MAG: hypothetical protein KAQ64_00600 [Candidatus Pacebacteria bacterium]|nr:hypothetical protein [Candidatus Paceibacterota bacterium]